MLSGLEDDTLSPSLAQGSIIRQLESNGQSASTTNSQTHGILYKFAEF